jgi:hypothetical protein
MRTFEAILLAERSRISRRSDLDAAIAALRDDIDNI